MKIKTLLIAILLVLTGSLFAQRRQGDSTITYKTTLSPEKQSLLDNVDVIANTQLNFRSDYTDGEFEGAKFTFEQFRMEIKGYVHENVFFRFRHRYTSTFEPQSIDKIIKGVDFAYLRFDIADKWQLFFGKMYADWGGIEFDLNPIDIYVYSDIIEMADNFLTGAEIWYQSSENHGFGFQILDSRTATFDELYGDVPGIEAAKIPLAGVLNWRGNFWNGKFSTLWSYSLFSEADGIGKQYIALGNLFQSDNWYVAYDFKISMEGLDRTGIVSSEIPDELYPHAVENTRYISHWTRITYKLSQKWRLSLDAFIDYAYWTDDLDPLQTEDKFRTVYSYIPTVEFYPWDNLNLKFFAGYVGRDFVYSDYAKTRPGLEKEDYSTGKLMIGIISPLHIL